MRNSIYLKDPEVNLCYRYYQTSLTNGRDSLFVFSGHRNPSAELIERNDQVSRVRCCVMPAITTPCEKSIKEILESLCYFNKWELGYIDILEPKLMLVVGWWNDLVRRYYDQDYVKTVAFSLYRTNFNELMTRANFLNADQNDLDGDFYIY